MDDDDDYDSDFENKSFKELIKIAEDYLLNKLGFSPDAIDEIDEWYIIDVLRDHHYDELASEIEEKLYDSYDSDFENKSFKELIKIAEDYLLNKLGFSPDAIDEIDEWYIIDVLRDHHYDELASEIEEKLYDSYDSDF
jgi:hypothetical protein